MLDVTVRAKDFAATALDPAVEGASVTRTQSDAHCWSSDAGPQELRLVALPGAAPGEESGEEPQRLRETDEESELLIVRCLSQDTDGARGDVRSYWTKDAPQPFPESGKTAEDGDGVCSKPGERARGKWPNAEKLARGKKRESTSRCGRAPSRVEQWSAVSGDDGAAHGWWFFRQRNPADRLEDRIKVDRFDFVLHQEATGGHAGAGHPDAGLFEGLFNLTSECMVAFKPGNTESKALPMVALTVNAECAMLDRRALGVQGSWLEGRGARWTCGIGEGVFDGLLNFHVRCALRVEADKDTSCERICPNLEDPRLAESLRQTAESAPLVDLNAKSHTARQPVGNTDHRHTPSGVTHL